MQEHEIKLIELEDATFIASEVVGVLKSVQPATLQTPEIPFIQVIIKDNSPVLIPYQTEEERDGAYELVKAGIKTRSW